MVNKTKTVYDTLQEDVNLSKVAHPFQVFRSVTWWMMEGRKTAQAIHNQEKIFFSWNKVQTWSLAGKSSPSWFTRAYVISFFFFVTQRCAEETTEVFFFHIQPLSLKHNGTFLAKGHFLVSIKWIPEEDISVRAMRFSLTSKSQEQHSRFSAQDP